MRRPELDRAQVLRRVEREAGAALVLAERVAHHREGRHRRLGRLQLAVDADDAPRRLGDVALALGLAGALLHELVVRVEDEVEVGGARRLEALEPAGQHRELAVAARLVAGAEQVRVVGRDAGDAGAGLLRRVLEEEVLAERRVAVDERRALLEGVDRGPDELVGVDADDLGAAERRVEVAEGEAGDADDLHGGSLVGLATDLLVDCGKLAKRYTAYYLSNTKYTVCQFFKNCVDCKERFLPIFK